VEERQLAAIVGSKSSYPVVSNPEIAWAIRDMHRGRPETAWRRLAAAARRDPDNVDVALALWSLSRDLGREAEAAEAMARAVRLEVRSGDVSNATDHWRELVGCVPDVTMDAASLVKVSKGLVDRGLRHEAAETLRMAFETSVRIPAHRDHRFRPNVITHSGDHDHRFRAS
jgi:hypothetical protein